MYIWKRRKILKEPQHGQTVKLKRNGIQGREEKIGKVRKHNVASCFITKCSEILQKLWEAATTKGRNSQLANVLIQGEF
jgi:hypothetical protein